MSCVVAGSRPHGMVNLCGRCESTVRPGKVLHTYIGVEREMWDIFIQTDVGFWGTSDVL